MASQTFELNHHFDLIGVAAVTHPKPGRSPKCSGGASNLLLVSQEDIVPRGSTETDLAPRSLKTFNSFEVQPGHRTGTLGWQGAGYAEPHVAAASSAADVACESAPSGRSKKRFLTMGARLYIWVHSWQASCCSQSCVQCTAQRSFRHDAVVWKSFFLCNNYSSVLCAQVHVQRTCMTFIISIIALHSPPVV